MNNGKVRIYELSKELNLDNKDVLAVCDRLEIPYKSYSSTLSEEQVVQVRQVLGGAAPSNSATAAAPADSPKAERKQEIVSVRRPTTPKADSGKPEIVARPAAPAKPQAERPSIVSPPRRPATAAESGKAPVKPARSEKPVAEKSEIVAPRPATPAASADTVKPASRSAAAPAPRPAMETKKPKPAAELLRKPEIVRRTEAKPERERSGEAPAPRPKVERRPEQTGPARPQLGQPAASSGVNKPAKPVKPIELVAPPSRPKVAASASGVPAAASRVLPNKPQKPTAPNPELKQRPKPATPVSSEDLAATVEVFQPVPPLELRRPTAPARPSRPRKGWEEEEEERAAASRKAGKAAAKAKRRQLIEDDDDDDLLTAEQETAAADALNLALSLARPSKPKAAQAKPVAAVMPSKGRKPRRESARERQHRRRMEREQKPVRPELISLRSSMTVQELAQLMVVPETDIIKSLFFKGIAATVTQSLDVATIEQVAEEFGILVEQETEESGARKTTQMVEDADAESLQSRPPVVTVMGHVDHGKTTLLDAIRKTRVAAGEAGGITQHIGAYHVDVEHNGEEHQIVFLDTPGHEAFTAMRARGARVTDIAILVVAADDGVRPQTLEAISHAKAAEVPLIVAINKCDKEEAQPDRVKQELTEYGLVPEEWGGDTVMVPVSAIKGENIDQLLEMILLVTEVEELVANPDRAARGTVIEAHLDKARGPVATLLVQNGTLRVGDVLVAGSVLGKVRAMVDDRGDRVEAATPSYAVEVLGLGDVPAAGDEFEVYGDEKSARAVATSRADEQRQSRLQQAMASRRVSLGTVSAQAQEGELKELNLILKADVQGSVEAILGSLEQLPQKQVQVRVLLAAPGEITETDVDLAAASGAVIVGFNTTLASGAKRAADEAGVDVRDYDIIYKLLEDIQAAMEGLLEPELVEEPLGQVEVRAVFSIGRGAVAGCYVQSGKAIRNCNIRVRRGSNLVYTGTLDSLKRMKEDVKEVNSGYECGIGLDSFSAWQEGDIIETYRMVTKRRTLQV
ncbi:translation initiation factor IF-2 [Synechococcus elongatus]|uniref:translation initiation factor IF-2 n=1 Tax=Synechococcus elongatus TaxID=32046 RepID=UPI0030CD44AE